MFCNLESSEVCVLPATNISFDLILDENTPQQRSLHLDVTQITHPTDLTLLSSLVKSLAISAYNSYAYVLFHWRKRLITAERQLKALVQLQRSMQFPYSLSPLLWIKSMRGEKKITNVIMHTQINWNITGIIPSQLYNSSWLLGVVLLTFDDLQKGSQGQWGS